MKSLRKFRVMMYLAVLAAASLLSGCATSETDNASARPWNSPYGWENGLPSSLTEGK
jgi:hypothetical protein